MRGRHAIVGSCVDCVGFNFQSSCQMSEVHIKITVIPS